MMHPQQISTERRELWQRVMQAFGEAGAEIKTIQNPDTKAKFKQMLRDMKEAMLRHSEYFNR